MRHRSAYTETILFAIAAVALLAISATSSHIGILNAIYRSGAWAKRGEILRAMMALYGVGFAVASVGSLAMVRYCGGTLCAHCFRWIRFLWREAIGTFRWLFATEHMRHHALWLALIVAVGAAVRCFFLAQPMRYDEAYTFLNFVNRGVFGLFFYPLPNNHVLHTLLVRISVEVLGSHPVAIRLPAFVAGLLSIPLAFALAKSLNAKPTAGFMAASMVAVFPYLVLYDTMARGYSLLVLISLCLVATGLRIISNPSAQLSVMMALLIALGLFDMPSFLFPIAGVLLWVALALLDRGYRAVWILSRVLVPCAIVAAATTVILYTPVAIASNGIHNIVANRFVQGEPFHQFLSSLPTHISGTARSFSRSIPTPFLVALVVLLIGGLYVTARERRWTTLLLLPLCLIGAVVVLFAKHAIPYDRTWIYLLPLVFVFIDAGLAGTPGLSASHLKKGLLVFSACVAVLLMNHNTISSYPDTGHFPEAPILVDILSEVMTPQDGLIVNCPADSPMHFYMWYKNVPAHRRAPYDGLAKRDFVVVKTSRQSVAEMTSRSVRLLTNFGDAELYVADMENDTKTFQQEDALDEE
jgi:4-amino-4-deoxy-L-arabinose transferase-like glycosyltransferase